MLASQLHLNEVTLSAIKRFSSPQKGALGGDAACDPEKGGDDPDCSTRSYACRLLDLHNLSARARLPSLALEPEARTAAA